MAESTTNIGLIKPLESEFVSINTLNENMDSVDHALGPLNSLPTSSTNVAGAISEIYDHLTDKPLNQLTLKQGVQVVQGGDVPAILHPTIKGRTLVNLLGRDGNCESLNGWAVYQGTLSLDATNKVFGNNGIKITSTADSSSMNKTAAAIGVNPAKHYLYSAYVKLGTASSVAIRKDNNGGGTAIYGALVTSTTAFTRVNMRLQPSDLHSGNFFTIDCNGSTGQTAYVDGVSLYQITAEEYEAIGGMTAAQIEMMYPYVDDMKHVNAVYIENKGKNLLPPFSEWNLSANTVVKEQYRIEMTSAGENDLIMMLSPNTTYTLSIESATSANAFVFLDIHYKDGSTGGIATNDGINSKSFTTLDKPIDRVRVGFLVTSTGHLFNPMLNVGSEPLSFEPQKPSYLYLPDCNLHSNVDGSVADRLYTDGQGKPRVTRRFREMVLDGSLAWAYNTDYTGYKVVRVTRPSGINESLGNMFAIKYDGKILNINNAAYPPTVDAIYTDGLHSYIGIADTDSGWGESYTPTADEIKAYFLGWKMGNGADTSFPPWSGSGTKMWFKLYNGVGIKHPSALGAPVVDDGSATTTVPTTFNNQGFTPYRLMYQLAQSVDEPVAYEGALMLHEGDNQVEVGTGIVVREVANPMFADNAYYIASQHSNPFYAPGRISHTVGKWLDVFRNGERDKYWWTGVTLSASFVKTYYDPSAAYSVTYLALDTYAIGIAPQTISAEYAPNIRESVKSLVREVVEARTETSVLANTKVQRQQPQWINATLLSNWTGTLRYSKSDTGIVTLIGDITSGVITALTKIADLPKGYIPSVHMGAVLMRTSGGADAGSILINSGGAVQIPTGVTLAAATRYMFAISYRVD
ncbi:hypothetical protein B1A99_29725 [Cohnella sp. CIP 111063]|uniref:hypothetical protein n=1 Tax=unclassified Cohnella TaxID=2636738 RepID=UPI000B8C3B09|nr:MULTISPECIES: hypothetical protein [unclassified Cohnella]OXS53551.1 hypothetical protein B1A99_29725 [Cohnella sp. CIP 111063]PRX61579.1 hypothetical protein B0G52_125101 [Cohnella sp. SGD-V74]